MISRYFLKKKEDLNILSQDIESIIHASKQNSEQSVSRKSLEPTVRLRKNSEELQKASEANPNMQFVRDKINDIFGV